MKIIVTGKNISVTDKIQDAMDAIGWNDKAAMDELMDHVIKLQPASE